MQPLLYTELTRFYHLIDPLEDHADEAASYRALLQRGLGSSSSATSSPPSSSARPTVLELGAGAGNNAFYLKKHFELTLTDLSNEMAALDRERNPECEHIVGDMRSLRLEGGRVFDAVLLHDAIMYMTTRDDLKRAAATAFLHTRPGGVALFAPDCVRETFVDETEMFENDDKDRGLALRCLMWSWDPDPNDETYVVDFAFLLREGNEVRAVHDRHIEGVFAQSTWCEVLERVGYEVELTSRALLDGKADLTFLCRRPQ